MLSVSLDTRSAIVKKSDMRITFAKRVDEHEYMLQNQHSTNHLFVPSFLSEPHHSTVLPSTTVRASIMIAIGSARSSTMLPLPTLPFLSLPTLPFLSLPTLSLLTFTLLALAVLAVTVVVWTITVLALSLLAFALFAFTLLALPIGVAGWVGDSVG